MREDWELTCTNVAIFKLKDRVDMLCTDVETGKRIKIIHPDLTTDEIWENIQNTASLYARVANSLPPSILFFGKKSEDDKNIIYDWTEATPCFVVNTSNVVVCDMIFRVNGENEEFSLQDVVTKKSVHFINYRRFSQVDVLMQACAHAIHDGEDFKIVIVGAVSEIDIDEITIDAQTISYFGPKPMVYANLVKEIESHIPDDI